MLVPLRWLADYIPLPDDLPGLAERLTRAGLEVTATRFVGVPRPAGLGRPDPGELVWARDKVVVAGVISVERHPNADTLKLVTVDYGAGTPKTVITGAPNIAPGQAGFSVVLGLNGSRYFAAGKDGVKAVATLAPKALRGIENDAMCMSNYELGVADDHDGIILLDNTEAPPGTPAQDLLGEVVLDLDVLPNMARCLGLLGVAREVAALTRAAVTVPAAPVPVPAAGVELVRVAVETPLCGRYIATVISGLSGGPAPRFLRSRLQAAGQRPVSHVVDVTNFVMFETAQPLHAFDYDALVRRAGGGVPAISVRPAKPGETLVTLDGVERKLTAENLVVADAAGPVALAGVRGGADTEVTAATTRVLLEAASFDAVSVRKTARQFNLFSESSTRYSRGLSPEAAGYAAARATALLLEHPGSAVAGPAADVYPAPPPPRTIELTRDEVERVLGVRLADHDIVPALEALQFGVTETLWGWTVTVPPTRLDVQAGPADLIEEVARLVGYDRLPERLLPMELPPRRDDSARGREERTRDILVELGFAEAVNYTLTGEADAAAVTGPPEGGFVTLVNPISPARAVLRRSLVPGLLGNLKANLDHAPAVRLFELGPVFVPVPGRDLPDEPQRLTLALAGRRGAEAWDDPLGVAAARLDFYDLKGAVEALATALGVGGLTFEPARDVPFLHPMRAARVSAGGVALGVLGELHPRAAVALKFPETPAFVADLDLTALLGAVPVRVQYRPVSPFPPASRDLAVVVPSETPADAVLAEVLSAGAGTLEAARLFDLYRGDPLPAGTKSLAYALTYRCADRQLTDKEVEKAHEQIEARLRQALGAKVRGKDGV